MAIVRFAQSLNFLRDRANQEKRQKCYLDNEGQGCYLDNEGQGCYLDNEGQGCYLDNVGQGEGVEKLELRHSTRSVRMATWQHTFT